MLVVGKLAEALSDKSCYRLDRIKLPLFHGNQGIFPFSSPPSQSKQICGNVIIDPSMTSPIQIINWESEPVGFNYINRALNGAIERRKKEENHLSISNPHSAFRLVNGLGDGLPGLAIDIYGKHAVIHMYSLHWQLYLPDFSKVLLKQQNFRFIDGIYLIDRSRNTKEDQSTENDNRDKNRFGSITSSAVKSQCIVGKKANDHKSIVDENGLLYHIQLDNGPAIGLYLDQRVNRQKLISLLNQNDPQKSNENQTSSISQIEYSGSSESPEPQSNNRKLSKASQGSKKTFLNTFSFTGSFSLAAAKFCDATTTSVDVSEPSLLWAKDNFVLNGLDPQKHEFIKKDVFTALAAFGKEKRVFDAVLLDPPTISRLKIRAGGKSSTVRPLDSLHSGVSRESSHLTYAPKVASKQTKTYFSALENYSDLIALSAPLVKPNGHLICFVNTHTLDKEKWRESIELGINSIKTTIKARIEEERLADIRAYLRKRGVKVKYRTSIIAKLKNKEVPLETIQKMYQFKVVDESFQDGADFVTREGDVMGNYLHGVVLQRIDSGIEIEPIPLPTLKDGLLHESRRKPSLSDPKDILNSSRSDSSQTKAHKGSQVNQQKTNQSKPQNDIKKQKTQSRPVSGPQL